MIWDLNSICKIPLKQHLDSCLIEEPGEGECWPGGWSLRVFSALPTTVRWKVPGDNEKIEQDRGTQNNGGDGGGCYLQ